MTTTLVLFFQLLSIIPLAFGLGLNHPNCDLTNTQDQGSTLRIFHVDSPCSPFKSSSPLSWEARVLKTLAEDQARLQYLTSLVAGRSVVPIASGRLMLQSTTYIVKVKIGTPAQSLLLAMDTSSDVAWLPCSGCVGCPSTTAFSPVKSTTFKNVSCSAPQCKQVPNPTCGASACSFNLTYGSSSIAANLSQDTIRLAADPITAFTFGCVNKVAGGGDINLSKSSWTYQVGLKGEADEIYTVEHNEKAEWSTLESDASPSIFMWYKTYFDTPDGTDPVVLDLESMGKGQAWVNGHHIGRYWSIISQKDGCDRICDYRGAYNSDKCTTNCGKPTQTRYHVPRSWLNPSSNLLVLFEETGGNPFKISVKTVTAGILCGQVSESHYPPLRKWSTPDFMNGTISMKSVAAPEMHLHCEEGNVISSIDFASYGTPRGSCEKFSTGKCHASKSLAIVSEACQGRNSCFIDVSNTAFRSDPCVGTLKTLAVMARCSPSQDTSYLGI